MSIEQRLSRLEDAVMHVERPLKSIVLRFNDQTEAEAIAASGRSLRPGLSVEFIHLVGINPTQHEGEEA